MTAGRAFRVLVLCTGNSARSQIGEALLTTKGATRAAGRVEAASAGTHPASGVHPGAITQLDAHGIPWRNRVPKHIDDIAGERFDLVVTVCDNARDACPIFPGVQAQVHWGLADPAGETDPVAARRAFADTFDALEARVNALLALPLESLEPAEVARRAQAIHFTVDA